MKIHEKCICGEYNIIDKKYCSNCGKNRIGIEDLEREFNAGKLYALNDFRKMFLTWVSGITIVITILGFLSFSELTELKKEYSKELQDIKVSKLKLEKSYKELNKLSNDFQTIFGTSDISSSLQSLYLTFFRIKNIYVQAEYNFTDNRHFNNRGMVKHALLGNLHISSDKKVSTLGGKNFMEFFALNEKATVLGKNSVLVQYNLFQPFERELLSKPLDIFDENIKYVQLLFAARHAGNYGKDSREKQSKMFMEIFKKIKSINLTVYVNHIPFWDLTLDNIKISQEYRNNEKNKIYELRMWTDKYDFSKNFDLVKNILNQRFNEEMKK